MADLHIHTVLSPCAEYRMVPELIVQTARIAGLDLIAITDHNSGENAGAVISAAKGSGVEVLPGMEVESREGVHLLAVFDQLDRLSYWQDRVYGSLPDRQNDERAFGKQLVVDAEGNLRSVNRRLLLTSTGLSVEEISAEVCGAGGICLPAHVDRPSGGLLGVLGMLPKDLADLAFEVSPVLSPAEARRRYPELRARTIIASSDAHALEEIGRATTSFLMASAIVREIVMACRGECGRAVVS